MVLLISLSDEDDGSFEIIRPVGDENTYLVHAYASRGGSNGLSAIAWKTVLPVGLDSAWAQVVELTTRCGDLYAWIFGWIDPAELYASSKPIKKWSFIDDEMDR